MTKIIHERGLGLVATTTGCGIYHYLTQVTCGEQKAKRALQFLMGGERASTVRQRLAGKICAICSRGLPAPHTPGEQRCTACGGPHLVYMTFMLRDGWCCQFLERDLKTPLPRRFNFMDEKKVIELAERGGYKMDAAGRQAINYAIGMGRGGVWLELSPEQYEKLKDSKR